MSTAETESVGKAALDNRRHDARSPSFAKIRLVSDPDVDRAQVRRHVAPVKRFLAPRVDELLAPVRVPRELHFPGPIVVRIRGDDMLLLVPAAQQLQVGGRAPHAA